MTGVVNGIITEHRSCLRCGYDIHGLAQTARCPECGCGAGWTLAVPLLRYLGAERMWRVRNAVRLIATGLNGFSVMLIAGWFAVWVLKIKPGDVIGIAWIISLLLPVLLYCGACIALARSLHSAVSLDSRFADRFPTRWLVAAGLPALLVPLILLTLIAIVRWRPPSEAFEVVVVAIVGFLFATHVRYAGLILEELSGLCDRRPLHRLSNVVGSIAIVLVLAVVGTAVIGLFTMESFVYVLAAFFTLPLYFAWATLSAILAACLGPHLTKELEAATPTASDASSSSPGAGQ